MHEPHLQKGHAGRGTTETDKGIDAILEIIISVNGEYFDSEVSPAKIGTKEVQVLMDEVA